MPANDRRTDLFLSAHGRRRAASRGFTRDLLFRLAAIADREVPVGGGCFAISASAEALAAARAEDQEAVPIDRLRGRILVIGADGEVITALIAHRHRGRRYRRNCQASRRRASGFGAGSRR